MTLRAPEAFEEFVDPVDGVRWRVDVGFLGSAWRCRWRDGCRGILDEPAEELQQGCCSVGAELVDEDEAMLVAALGASLEPTVFERHDEAAAGGVLSVGAPESDPVAKRDDRRASHDGGEERADPRRHTRVVDGACIFFNRPGFAGGVGCALHLGAVAEGDPPMDWKPSVCWQLPLKVEVDAADRRILRRWSRDDWGPGGASMAWCCTEVDETYDGEDLVSESMIAELRGIVGPEVAVEITRRVRS